MTHDKLVEKAANFLKYKKNCGVVVKEFHAATLGGERPDVLGWKGRTSYLIECKTSIEDFKADRKKKVRKFTGRNEYHNRYGVGQYRYYFVEDGLIEPEDIPDNWGLVYLDGRSYKEIIICDGAFYNSSHAINKDELSRYNKPTIDSLKNEIATLTSLVRRLIDNGGKCKWLK